MLTEEFRNILKERIRISEETQDNWSEGIEACWKKEIELISDNIEAAVVFLETDCTADEFSWLSEIADDVAKITKSSSFVDAMSSLCVKYPEELAKYNIEQVLEIAENYLSE